MPTGVNQSMFKRYDFSDHVWFKDGETDLLEMTQFVVFAEKRWWVEQPNTGIWLEKDTKTLARDYVRGYFRGITLKSGRVVDDELIEEYFTGIRKIKAKKGWTEIDLGAPPQLKGVQFLPECPKFIVVDKETYLNVAYVEFAQPLTGEERIAKAVLLMVYKALCNARGSDTEETLIGLDGSSGTDNTGTQMLSERLLSDLLADKWDNEDFRFAMNWMAAIYQFPGINLLTNLWLVGDLQGIGKGTIVKVMRLVLGNGVVGAMLQQEVEGTWTDFIFGNVLMEVDEFDTENSKLGPKGWNKWIKRHTCEPWVPLRKRNVGSFDVINITNYIFTSNDECPIYLDQSDRRNYIIKTTDDVRWRGFASVIQNQLINKCPERVAGAWAWVLSQVKVDMSILRAASLSNAKMSIQMNSMSHPEEWVRDGTFERGVELSAGDLFDEYKRWLNKNHPESKDNNITAWGREMKRLAKGPAVTAREIRNRVFYTVNEITDELNQLGNDRIMKAVELGIGGAMALLGDLADDYKKPVDVQMPKAKGGKTDQKLAQMRAALKKQQDDEPF